MFLISRASPSFCIDVCTFEGAVSSSNLFKIDFAGERLLLEVGCEGTSWMGFSITGLWEAAVA